MIKNLSASPIVIYGCPEHPLPSEKSRLKIGVTLNPNQRFSDMLGHRPDINLSAIHSRDIVNDPSLFRPTKTNTFLVVKVDGKNVEPDEFIHKMLRLKGYKSPDKGDAKGKHTNSEVFINLDWKEVDDLITLAINNQWEWNKCRKAILLNKPSLNLYVWQAWNVARRKDTRLALPDEDMLAEFSCPRFGKTTRELYEFWESDDALLILVQYNLSAVTSFFNELDTYCEFADIEKYDLTDVNVGVDSLPSNLTVGKKVIAISLCGDEDREKYVHFCQFIQQHADPSRTRIEMDEVDFGAVTEKSRAKMDRLRKVLPKVKVNIFSGTGEDKVNFKMDTNERVRASAIRTSYVELLHIRDGKHYIFTPQYKVSLDSSRNKHEVAFLNSIPTTNYRLADGLVEPTFYNLRVDPEILLEIDKVHREKGDDDPRLGFSYNKINRNPIKYASVHQSIWKKFLGIGPLKGCQLDYTKCTRGKLLKVFVAWTSGIKKTQLHDLAEVLNNDSELSRKWIFHPVCGQVGISSTGKADKWGWGTKGGTPAMTNKHVELKTNSLIDNAQKQGKGVVFLAIHMAQRSFSVPRIDGVVFYRDDLPSDSAEQKFSRALTPGIDYYGNPKKVGHIFNLSLTPNSSLIENYIYSEINEQARSGISAKVAAARLFEVINVWEMDHLGEMQRKDTFTDADFTSYGKACRTMYARSEIREMILGIGNMNDFMEMVKWASTQKSISKKDRDVLKDMVDNAAGDDSERHNTPCSDDGDSDKEQRADNFTHAILMIRRLLYESVLNMAAIYCHVKGTTMASIEKDNVPYSKILGTIRDNTEAVSIFTAHFGFASEDVAKKIIGCILRWPLDDKLTANLHSVILETAFGKELKDIDINSYFYANAGDGKIHTPPSMVNDIMTKWESTAKGNLKVMSYLDPHCKTGTFLRWIHLMLKRRGMSEADIQQQIMGVEDDPVYLIIARHISGINNIQYKNLQDEAQLAIFKAKYMKKFDVIVGNPPYQAPQEVKNEKGITGGGDTLWDKFIVQSTKLLKPGGHLCYVHPAGWRGLGKNANGAREALRQGQMHYLEVHNADDGMKTFGATTRYDWYVWQKISPCKPTVVKGEDGIQYEVNLANMPFIPNGMYDEIQSLIAKDGEERVEVLYDRTAYGSDKKNMSKEQAGEFKYPCVYYVNKKGEPTLWYSSINTNGHFGVPKVIFASGVIKSVGYMVDAKGEYGLTQFAKGIVDTPENLSSIAKALDSQRFRTLMEMCVVAQTELNKDILATFRKYFWKQFID